MPELDKLSQKIFTKLKKSDAGVASGTARQKKAADQLIGQAMMERYPIVQQATQFYPPLGDFLEKNPNMVSYVAQLLLGGVGKITEKMQLPPEVTQLLAAFGGAPPEQ